MTRLEQELDSIFRDAEMSDASRNLIRALLLLWHDHLDPAHQIAQAIETPDGSFLHAMMHRREPDYWNSKYWWRRAGGHPCLVELGRRAGRFLGEHGEDDLIVRLVRKDGQWDACAFVDACEAAADAARNPKRHALLRELQRIETEVLLDHFL